VAACHRDVCAPTLGGVVLVDVLAGKHDCRPATEEEWPRPEADPRLNRILPKTSNSSIPTATFCSDAISSDRTRS
jgi:hypothetical protein